MRSPQAELDHSVPALFVRIGRYPNHHGTVAAIRTLGRAGVPVYAITEDRYTPAATSRYTTRRFVWPTTGHEPEAEILDELALIGRRLDTLTIAIGTDDESAVFLAEHAQDLREWFITPPQPPELPRRLASKRGLYELCTELDVATPRSLFVDGRDELDSFASEATFPLVIKNVDPWVRLTSPAVAGTTCVADPNELRRLAAAWPNRARVMVQEFIPHERSEDWIVHVCVGRDGTPLVTFTGRKIRSWPPHAGQTSYATVEANRELAEEADRLCGSIGYRGIADMCWRFDERDRRNKLLDFNPRLGAQFDMFRTEQGIDVVRALHLDLTGRPVPRGRPVNGRAFVVENLDFPAFLSYRRERRATMRADAAAPRTDHRSGRRKEGPGDASRLRAVRRPRRPVLAWSALDDPLPVMILFLRAARFRLLRLMRLR